MTASYAVLIKKPQTSHKTDTTDRPCQGSAGRRPGPSGRLVRTLLRARARPKSISAAGQPCLPAKGRPGDEGGRAFGRVVAFFGDFFCGADRDASTAARDNSALPNLFFAPPLRVPPARPHALPPPRAASPAPQAQHLPPLPHARAPHTPQRARQARRCAAEAQASPRTAKTSTRPPVLRSP